MGCTRLSSNNSRRPSGTGDSSKGLLRRFPGFGWQDALFCSSVADGHIPVQGGTSSTSGGQALPAPLLDALTS